MAQRQSNILVVAHPDDESIFFSGLVLSSRKAWHLVCVTDGNGDGRGIERQSELAAACRRLGIKSYEQWAFRDIYDRRLDVDEISQRLRKLPLKPSEIYTHGIIGEYGHPHHQDVSWATHLAFGRSHKVWSVAYNCRPEKLVKLTPKHYEIKTDILNRIYAKETQRFAHLLPVTAHEGFVHLGLAEAEEIYRAIMEGRAPSRQRLRHYRAWSEIFPHTMYWNSRRLF